MNSIRESFYRKVAEKGFSLDEEVEEVPVKPVESAAEAAARRVQKSVLRADPESKDWHAKAAIGPQKPGTEGDAIQQKRAENIAAAGDLATTAIPAAAAVKALALGAKTVPKIISAVGATGAAAYSARTAFASDKPADDHKPALPSGSNASTAPEKTAQKFPSMSDTGDVRTPPATPAAPAPGEADVVDKINKATQSTVAQGTELSRTAGERLNKEFGPPPVAPAPAPKPSSVSTADTGGYKTPQGGSGSGRNDTEYNRQKQSALASANDTASAFGPSAKTAAKPPTAPATPEEPSVKPRPAPSSVSTADTGGDKYGSGNASAGFERGKYAAPDAADNSSGANELRSKQQAVDRHQVNESKSKYMSESKNFEKFLRKNKYGKIT